MLSRNKTKLQAPYNAATAKDRGWYRATSVTPPHQPQRATARTPMLPMVLVSRYDRESGVGRISTVLQLPRFMRVLETVLGFRCLRGGNDAGSEGLVSGLCSQWWNESCSDTSDFLLGVYVRTSMMTFATRKRPTLANPFLAILFGPIRFESGRCHGGAQRERGPEGWGQRVGPQGAGVSHDNPRTPNVHMFRVPALQKHHQNSIKKTPRERKITKWEREREK